MASRQPKVRVRDVSMVFESHGHRVVALDRIALDVGAGEFLCILELDASTLDSMQKLNAELGYLKYKDFLSADKLFTLTYRDRALAELGRR